MYVIDYCLFDTVQTVQLTKMDLGQLNIEIGQKMANGHLLFLPLNGGSTSLGMRLSHSYVVSETNVTYRTRKYLMGEILANHEGIICWQGKIW